MQLKRSTVLAGAAIWAFAVSATAAPTIDEYTIPTANSNPQGITAGPDGNLWFTEFGGNKIGRITTQGVTTEFPTPTANSHPAGITAGPDGNVWFTELTGPLPPLNQHRVGKITPAGTITEYSYGPINFDVCAAPASITTDANGLIWIAGSCAIFVGMTTDGTPTIGFGVNGATSDVVYGLTTGPDGNLWATVR